MTPLLRPLSLLLALSGAGCCLAISSPEANAAPIIEWECNGQPSSAPGALTDTRLAELEKLSLNAMKSAFAPFDKRIRIIFDTIKPGFAKVRAGLL